MQQGIAAMMGSASLVAKLPGAVVPIAAIGNAAFALMVVGGLWLTLWRKRWRLLGLRRRRAAGIRLRRKPRRPDILAGLERIARCSSRSRRSARGHIRGRATFELARWLEHDGDSREPKDVLNKRQAFRCDGIGCVAKAAGDTTSSVARHGSAFADDCAAADHPDRHDPSA